jgi:uncharacterized membrane protein
MAVHLTVIIRRPSDEVFDYISDLERLSTWHHAIDSVEKITGGDNRTGATYRMKRTLPAGHVENRVSVTEFDPAKRFTIESQPGPKPFAYRFRLAPAPQGTRVDVDASRDGLDLDRAPAVPPALASALFQRRMAESLRRLKHELEHERSTPRPTSS